MADELQASAMTAGEFGDDAAATATRSAAPTALNHNFTQESPGTVEENIRREREQYPFRRYWADYAKRHGTTLTEVLWKCGHE